MYKEAIRRSPKKCKTVATQLEKRNTTQIVQEYEIFTVLEEFDAFSSDLVKHLILEFATVAPVVALRKTAGAPPSKYPTFGNFFFTTPFLKSWRTDLKAPRLNTRFGFMDEKYSICLRVDKDQAFTKWVQRKCKELLTFAYSYGVGFKNQPWKYSTLEDFMYHAKLPFYETDDGLMLRCKRHYKLDGPITLWKETSKSLEKQEIKPTLPVGTLMQFRIKFRFWCIRDGYCGVALQFGEQIIIKD